MSVIVVMRDGDVAMGRQPLMSTYEVRRQRRRIENYKPSLAFGTMFAQDRPVHVRLIGACLIQWTMVETNLATLLAALLRANTNASIAVYLSLRRSAPRQDAIARAAEAMLDRRSNALVLALLKHAKSVETQRNDLAHGWWGCVHDIEDGIAWISQEKMTLSHVNIQRPADRSGRISATQDIVDNTFVYRKADLLSIFNAMQTLEVLVNNFRAYITCIKGDPPLALNDEIYERLASAEDIRRLVGEGSPPEYVI